MERSSPKDSGQRQALGRGLAALIPTAAAATAAGLRILPIERIRPSRRQPRKHFDQESLDELAASIQMRGILQPIVVRRRGDDYELVAGERRWRAASRAGLKEIPAIIKELTDSDALQVALIENLQRQDLDPLEEAEAYLQLIRQYSMAQDQVADAVGKSRSAIANSLRLLKLPQEVLKMLAEGKITAGHARPLMSLDSDEAIMRLATKISKRKLSVREVEREVRLLTKKPKKAMDQQTPAEQNVEERLQRALGTKIRLRHRRGKGKIEIYFHSLEQLDDLLSRIAP
ncbi:MAG: ParB/RepB/Spo0J family partition protein [Myxococcota bacterium]